MEKEIKNNEKKVEKKVRMKKCPICGREYEGYGNNPEPLNYRGQVCDECNAYIIIPTRLAILQYMNRIQK